MNDDRFSAPVLLYGLLDADALTDDVLTEEVIESARGVSEQPVSLVESCGFAVLVSTVEDTTALRSPQAGDALAHKSVVDVAFAHRTVIPVRFGTTVSTPGELDDLVRKRSGDYRDLLDRLDGYAEMGVRLTLREEPVRRSASPEAAYRTDRPGTAYLLARQQKRTAQRGQRRRAARAYRTALAGLSADTTTSGSQTGDGTVSMAFLVARSNTDAFRDAADRVDAPGVAAVDVVGPWAPYSFV